MSGPQSSPVGPGRLQGPVASAVPQTGLWVSPMSQSGSLAEAKIRQWLMTIDIGNGAERGWDDAQILEIAAFAQERGLDQASAEEMYKRWVEWQVERADL